MKKRIYHFCFLLIIGFFAVMFAIRPVVAMDDFQFAQWGPQMSEHLMNEAGEKASKEAALKKQIEEAKKMCAAIKNAQPKSGSNKSLGGGIVPDSVISNIYQTTEDLSDSISLISVLGDALMCHAVRVDPLKAKIFGVTFFEIPNISVWLCGAIIYFFGFMFLLSITFYIIDVCFKLGFAVLLLPVGVALWPFKITSDKLTKLIYIILKSAAIFAFLAITVSYALNLLSASVGGITSIFDAISTSSNTDFVSKRFTLFSVSFLVILASLIYGFKLIGATIPDYVDKFFPDNVFGGQAAAPMHHMATQAVDFAKKKAVSAVSLAGDIAATQGGKATVALGNALQGEYNDDIRRFARSPGAHLRKAGLSMARSAAIPMLGAAKTWNRVKYGAQMIGADAQKKAELQTKRDQEINRIDGVYGNLQGAYKTSIENLDKQIEDKDNEKNNEHDLKMQTRRGYRIWNKTKKILAFVPKEALHLSGSILTRTGKTMQQRPQRNNRWEQEQAAKKAKEELEEQARQQQFENSRDNS